jgi:6-pyruvoyltetrahydropterin/6-carboxytetrahydropterin synthase
MPYAITWYSPEFGCAHRLNNMPVGHKCARLHGHNYRLAVRLTSKELTNGMVVDAGVVKEMVAPYLDNVDHYSLNDLPHDGEATKRLTAQPTAENLARWFYEGIKPIEERFPGVKIECVAVQENGRLTAEYVP